MKVIYDPDTDTLSLLFKEEPVAESDELREGLIIDYGCDEKSFPLKSWMRLNTLLNHKVSPMSYEVDSKPPKLSMKTVELMLQ